jgi:hypothetical protein
VAVKVYTTAEEKAAANRRKAQEASEQHLAAVRAHKTKLHSVGLTGMWREQGAFWVPDRQSKLDQDMMGQVMWCPNCGTDHPATTSGEFTCTKCRAHYAVSLGVNPATEEVAVVRWDRHR